MDFREHQDRAKRNSRIIWFLYILLLSISSLLIGWTFIVGLNLAELYQSGYEQYSFGQKFSASNSHAFDSEQIQILLSFSAIAFIVQASTTAFGFFKKSDGHKVAVAFNARLLDENSANSLAE
ncbi:hypothetical protein AZO1586I_2378, partial [Bathymodiolus thermophilus thioautotrophic gill symbiont]